MVADGQDKKTWVWMSYDLGFLGDISRLYEWLDNHQARECGDGLAAVRYEGHGDDLIADLERELKEVLGRQAKSCRVYIVWNDSGRVRGQFLFGRRRAAPWKGHGNLGVEQEEEVA